MWRHQTVSVRSCSAWSSETCVLVCCLLGLLCDMRFSDCACRFCSASVIPILFISSVVEGSARSGVLNVCTYLSLCFNHQVVTLITQLKRCSSFTYVSSNVYNVQHRSQAVHQAHSGSEQAYRLRAWLHTSFHNDPVQLRRLARNNTAACSQSLTPRAEPSKL